MSQTALAEDSFSVFCLFTLIWGRGRSNNSDLGYSKGQTGRSALAGAFSQPGLMSRCLLSEQREGGFPFLFSFFFSDDFAVLFSSTLVHAVLVHLMSTYYVPARPQPGSWRV